MAYIYKNVNYQTQEERQVKNGDRSEGKITKQETSLSKKSRQKALFLFNVCIADKHYAHTPSKMCLDLD